MSVTVANVAGDVVCEATSDAEACRWYVTSGRRGDYLVETGELLSDVTSDVLGIDVTFDSNDCVTPVTSS